MSKAPTLKALKASVPDQLDQLLVGVRLARSSDIG